MASVNRPNLLFYSRTNNCIELLRMMKQYQIDKEFKIINVDNNKNEVIKKIKVVPTMIIPSINKVIVGEDVNDFVISIIKSRIKEPINNTQLTDEQHNKLIDKPILDKSTLNITNEEVKETNNYENKNNKITPILGYIEDEMGGLSDKYSYLNINISPMHNYGYY